MRQVELVEQHHPALLVLMVQMERLQTITGLIILQ